MVTNDDCDFGCEKYTSITTVLALVAGSLIYATYFVMTFSLLQLLYSSYVAIMFSKRTESLISEISCIAKLAVRSYLRSCQTGDTSVDGHVPMSVLSLCSLCIYHQNILEPENI